jgi:hypothetical protein
LAAEQAKRSIEHDLRVALQAAVDRLAPAMLGAASRRRAPWSAIRRHAVLTLDEATVVRDAIRLYERLLNRLQPARKVSAGDDDDDPFLGLSDLEALPVDERPPPTSSTEQDPVVSPVASEAIDDGAAAPRRQLAGRAASVESQLSQAGVPLGDLVSFDRFTLVELLDHVGLSPVDRLYVVNGVRRLQESASPAATG